MSDVNATVPDAFLKAIVRSAVGSVMAKRVSKSLVVVPSKMKGVAPAISAPVKSKTPVAVSPVFSR